MERRFIKIDYGYKIRNVFILHLVWFFLSTGQLKTYVNYRSLVYEPLHRCRRYIVYVIGARLYFEFPALNNNSF